MKEQICSKINNGFLGIGENLRLIMSNLGNSLSKSIDRSRSINSMIAKLENINEYTHQISEGSMGELMNNSEFLREIRLIVETLTILTTRHKSF
jgi:hypothetical protein